MIKAFDALAPAADRERVEGYRLEKTAAFIDRHAGGYKGKRVLELGSSLGVHLLYAKELGASEVIGLDKFIFPDEEANDFVTSQEQFNHLKNAWDKAGVTVIKHDLAEKFPFEDGSFDLVVCNAVIEHLHGAHKDVFLETRRVLKPGGSFVFTTPNLASLLKRVRFLFGRSPMWDMKDYFDQGHGFTGHVREFTVKECREMLVWTGFQPTCVEAKTGYFKWSWLKQPRKWHIFLFQAMARPFSALGDLIYAAGKKSV